MAKDKSGSKTVLQEHPTDSPPEGSTVTLDDGPPGLEKPIELTAEQLTGDLGAEAGGSPTLEPPPAETAGTTQGITAWQADKRVTALWSGASIRNSWVYIGGIGWKKLHNQSDTAITAMTMMLSHARQAQSRVDYREEADGMIYEVYVW